MAASIRVLGPAILFNTIVIKRGVRISLLSLDDDILSEPYRYW